MLLVLRPNETRCEILRTYGFVEGDSTFSTLRSVYIFVLCVRSPCSCCTVDVKSKVEDGCRLLFSEFVQYFFDFHCQHGKHEFLQLNFSIFIYEQNTDTVFLSYMFSLGHNVEI